jgi:hypothetical protein
MRWLWCLSAFVGIFGLAACGGSGSGENGGGTVDPHEDGATLSVEIQYAVPVPVLGRLAERVLLRRNAREFEVGIVTIKDVLEH